VTVVGVLVLGGRNEPDLAVQPAVVEPVDEVFSPGFAVHGRLKRHHCRPGPCPGPCVSEVSSAAGRGSLRRGPAPEAADDSLKP
jgi:hypothetical protein